MVRRISAIMPLLFITLFCVGCVEGGYLILEHLLAKMEVTQEQGFVEPVAQERRSTNDTQQEPDYMIIVQRNIFGSPPPLDDGEFTVDNDPVQEMDVTSLDIVLKGTISVREGKSRAIILDKIDKKQNLYQEGDTIQGAFVKEILRTKVILSYNGRDEALIMSDTAGTAESPSPIAVNPQIERGAAFSENLRKPARRIVQPQSIRPVRRLVGGNNTTIQPIE